MTLAELRYQIRVLTRAIESCAVVAGAVDAADLGRTGAAYVTALKWHRDSMARALASRVAYGEK